MFFYLSRSLKCPVSVAQMPRLGRSNAPSRSLKCPVSVAQMPRLFFAWFGPCQIFFLAAAGCSIDMHKVGLVDMPAIYGPYGL